MVADEGSARMAATCDDAKLRKLIRYARDSLREGRAYDQGRPQDKRHQDAWGNHLEALQNEQQRRHTAASMEG